MIAYLVGQPILQNNELIMLVNGVGYGVVAGGKTLTKIATLPKAELWIYTHVREEALDLYGFSSAEDKRLFQILLSVSGVGPRTALAVVEMGGTQIIDAVQTANVAFFSAVPRVGKKLAQKIIIELKPKLGSIQELNLGPRSQQESDVVDALTSLGFSDQDIQRAVQTIDFASGESANELIKQAIKVVGRSS